MKIKSMYKDRYGNILIKYKCGCILEKMINRIDFWLSCWRHCEK